MKRILFAILVLTATSGCLHAQNEQQEINEIKRSLNFIYATGTSTNSAEEASANARELLSLEIEQWLNDNVEGDFSGYIAKSKQNVAEIKTQRGKLSRVFVYVRKSDILPYNNEESVMVVNTMEQEGTPVSVDTITFVKSDLNMSQLSSGQQTSSEIAQVTQQALSQPTFEVTANEKDMLAVRNLSQINRYVADGSKVGRVTSYGKYDSATRLFGKSYLFLFDKEGKVMAVLRKNGDDIVNLSTGSSDAVANYGRCGVVWFQCKE